MPLLLLIFLVIAILSLFLINQQKHNRDFKTKGYGSKKDYLEDVKEATKKRFEEEAEQQNYKNNIKKDYLK